MSTLLNRLWPDIPDRFRAVLVVVGLFGIFVTVDQIHWWNTKPDYAFGWLVPAFVIYALVDRWSRVKAVFDVSGPSPVPPWQRLVLNLGAAAALGGGLLIFLMGALYRGTSGVTQPGSLALALGFSGLFLGMVYFNVPSGRLRQAPAPGWFETVRSDARVRAVSLFLFPALIWILSAPLVTAVENAISLFLLRKVIAVDFFVFSALGYPLVQQGNVLMLPLGPVGVEDACSGIRSLTACLFAGSFLAAVFLDRLWKKVVLVGVAMSLAFVTNLLRSLFLTAWAYAYGSEAIAGTLHDATGFAILGLTCIGLFCLLPFFNASNWRRWLG
ncbi:MAG: exosortase/archaeosortase family protein [Opitutaceae bacterium]